VSERYELDARNEVGAAITAELMEWDDPSQYVDSLSLEDSKRHHQWVLRAMYTAKKQLEAARNNEVAKRKEFKSAKRRAQLSAERPKVSRGAWTTAEQAAWVESQPKVEKAEFEYDLAKAAREAAEDQLDTLRSQSITIGSLAKLVQKIFDAAGAR
jgi:hypothetical protein